LVDKDVALIWASLRVPNHENALDEMIAATALSHSLTLVTRKTKDFNKTGVAIFNPLSLTDTGWSGTSIFATQCTSIGMERLHTNSMFSIVQTADPLLLRLNHYHLVRYRLIFPLHYGEQKKYRVETTALNNLQW